MKKLTTLFSVLCLTLALTVPASALEYNIDGPGDPEYGKSTSIEPVVTADRGEMPNVDVSKNAALIPPTFGSPTAYTLNTGNPLTPNLAPGYMLGEGAVINGNTGVTVAPPDNIRIEKDGMIFMEQNHPTYFETLKPEIFAECFENRFIDTALPIQIVSTGLKDVMLPVISKDHLEKLNPQFINMANLCRKLDVVGIHAFALTNNADTTAICRNFAPLYGINEESATGTSNCALACYLFKHYKQQSQYVFEQGFNLGSASRLIVNITQHDSTIDTVSVGGYGYLECKKMLSV